MPRFRWLGGAPRVSARASQNQAREEEMTTTAHTTKTVQMYRVYIKATPQAIWDAITKPEWTKKYGYAPLVEYDLRAGGHVNEAGSGHSGCHHRWGGRRGEPSTQARAD